MHDWVHRRTLFSPVLSLFACDSEWRTVHRRLPVGESYCLRISKPESRFSPSAAGEVDDACAGQMRQSLSVFRPVTNEGSIAGAATLTASLRSARAQLARQFEQGIFISFVPVTGFAWHRLLAAHLSILPARPSFPECCALGTAAPWDDRDRDGWVPASCRSRSRSSRAFLNSFMLCPMLRAKSGNFFAPKRTKTIKRTINRSGPARFPSPNARVFILC